VLARFLSAKKKTKKKKRKRRKKKKMTTRRSHFVSRSSENEIYFALFSTHDLASCSPVCVYVCVREICVSVYVSILACA